MSDESVKYVDVLRESAEIRHEINTVHFPMYGHLKKAFEMIFVAKNLEAKQFKRLCDLVYYQGGWPSPNTPAREISLADDLANSLKLEHAIGRTRLLDLLAERGIHVTFDEIADFDVVHTTDLREELAGGGVSLENGDTALVILRKMVDAAQGLQKVICNRADDIKVHNGDLVETQFEIKRNHFVKAVNIEASRIRAGSEKVDEKVEKVLDDIANLETAIEPVRNSAVNCVNT